MHSAPEASRATNNSGSRLAKSCKLTSLRHAIICIQARKTTQRT